MQRERRRDPYPWTWEVPVAITVTVILVIVTGVQVGRSLANLASGAGWTWPTTHAPSGGGPGPRLGSPVSSVFWTSLPGDPAAGLPPSAGSGYAGAGLLWTAVTLTELALLALTTCGCVWVSHRWGPGRMHGMATAAEAERLLGLTRLRAVAPLVRPDLYGRHAHPDAPVHRDTDVRELGPAPRGTTTTRGGLPGRWLRTRSRHAGRDGTGRR